MHRKISRHGMAMPTAPDYDSASQGASFSVELPLRSRRHATISALRAEAEKHGDNIPSLQGLKIMLIDDQEEVRESLTMVLTVAGVSVFSAASSKEIFDWLNTAGCEQLPTVIVSDIAMPVEDGYTVLCRLRAWKSSEGDCPSTRFGSGLDGILAA